MTLFKSNASRAFVSSRALALAATRNSFSSVVSSIRARVSRRNARASRGRAALARSFSFVLVFPLANAPSRVVVLRASRVATLLALSTTSLAAARDARGISSAVGASRVAECFDVIVEFPDSKPALMDLRRCLRRTTLRFELVRSLRDTLRARLLICECTFVDDRCSAEDARRYGHTHIDDLVARADAFRETGAILLIHFSARYKAEEVREALAARLPEALKAKVTPMLEGFG